MKIKVELKTKVENDEFGRVPDINKIKEAIEEYTVGFKGLIVLHNSIYDYQYDTRNKSYNDVDTKSVIGHIISSEIEDDKLFLIIEVTDTTIEGDRYICFFRSRMETTPDAKDNKFNDFNIFAVDLVNVEESEQVTERYLSEVSIIPD